MFAYVGYGVEFFFVDFIREFFFRVVVYDFVVFMEGLEFFKSFVIRYILWGERILGF